MSITLRYCIETAAWIELMIFCCGFFSTYMLRCASQKLGYLHSHTTYVHKLPLWARVTNEKLECNLQLLYTYPEKMTVTKLEGDQIHLVPRFSKLKDASHGSHRMVVPMKPLRSILITHFISNNSAKKLLKPVHAFQFLTHYKENQSSHSIFIT